MPRSSGGGAATPQRLNHKTRAPSFQRPWEERRRQEVVQQPDMNVDIIYSDTSKCGLAEQSKQSFTLSFFSGSHLVIPQIGPGAGNQRGFTKSHCVTFKRCPSRITTHVGLYLSPGANKGAHPSRAPPPLCQAHNGVSETRLLNVCDYFLSALATTGGKPCTM